jgi:XTP/dITP diphosphohydrolase
MRLLVATTNPDKLREIREILGDARIALLSLTDLPPVEEPEETGTTFEENARLKSLYYDAHARRAGLDDGSSPLLTVAEDSGFVVDALDGEPGVYSARFVRPDASYAERFAEIYRRLDARQAPRPWTARFVCALSVTAQGRAVFETRGIVEGEVADTPSGDRGFGYDPIFFFPPYGTTLAEVSQADKLRVAHRGHAFRALGRWLSEGRPY